MKNFNLTLTIIALLFFTALTAANVKAQTAFGGRLLTVNDNGDSNDSNAGDGICLDANGKCTLRAAIQESNATPGFNVINFILPQTSTINLTLGELLITKVVQIIGPGARNLTIQRSSAAGTLPFRIFHVGANVALNMIIRGFTVRNGNIDGDGGAFYIEQGNSIRMTEVAISNNSAGRGGGIANAGTLNLTRSLVNSNNSLILNGAGGGVMNIDAGSSAIISDSTLTENTAVNGGAIYNQGSLLLVNNTITQNAATQFGSSIVSAASGTINVLNTIIGMDTASTISSLWGAFNTLGNNLITDGRNSTGFSNGANSDQVSDNNTINPLLGSLTDNGGQTDTRALLPGSPAINHGNNCVTAANCAAPVPTGFRLTSDQRSVFTRIGGGMVDVGAVESDALTSGGGSLSFGTIAPRIRLGGSLLILTNARTGKGKYRIANSVGSYFFTNLTLEVYIFEIKSKRSGLGSVQVFEFDNLPFLPPSALTDFNYEKENIKIIFAAANEK